MTDKKNDRQSFLCPGCKKKQTLGNSVSTSKGYLCIDCIKKEKLPGKIVPEEKDLNCYICKKQLSLNNLIITPTILICKDCFHTFNHAFSTLHQARESVANTRYTATISLIFLIISIYIVTSFPFFTKINPYFVFWGAMVPTGIDQMQLWRVVTANLLHADFMHLAANTISILIWGHLLERVVGTRAMFILFVLAGFFTTLFSYFLGPDTFSLGASGIAYGLMFAFLIYVLVLTVFKNPRQFGGQLISFGVLMGIQILYNIQYSSKLDIWGHLGGSVAGILFISVYLIFLPLLAMKQQK
jgi:membrane associated rhomboid family serine protease